MIQIDAAKAEARRVAAIKREAGRVILARLPGWKQRNMIARALDIEKRDRLGQATAAELNEQAIIESWWQWVSAVRDESDRLELDGLTVEAAAWPAPPA